MLLDSSTNAFVALRFASSGHGPDHVLTCASCDWCMNSRRAPRAQTRDDDRLDDDAAAERARQAQALTPLADEARNDPGFAGKPGGRFAGCPEEARQIMEPGRARFAPQEVRAAVRGVCVWAARCDA